MERTLIGELAQVNGMKPHVLSGLNTMKDVFTRMERRVKKGKNPYKANEIMRMIKSLNAMKVQTDSLDLLEDKPLIEKVKFHVMSAYNSMVKNNEEIEKICNEQEKEAYFEMSEQIHELFELFHKAEDKKTFMNIVRNWS